MKAPRRFSAVNASSRSLDAARWRTIAANLFPAALPAVEPWQAFRWHSAAGNVCDSYKEHSSQALMIDVLGTLKMSPHRDQVLDHLAQALGVPAGGPWDIQLEWRDPDNLLREKTSTWADAVAASPSTLIFFEGKFCETDGGTCSQVRPIASGRNQGRVPCNRAYTPQVNPVNGRAASCALTGKGLRYWDIVPEVFNFPNDLGYRPCPFAGPWFQWMRNLTVCWAVAGHSQRRPAFVLAYADGPTLPMAERIHSADWQRFLRQVKPGAITVETRSYQALVELAHTACPKDPVWPALAQWVQRKISSVCQARQVHIPL
jgi:hypothetical protein